MAEAIRLEHIRKDFVQKDSEVHALNDVSITIEEGDIFGIIGYSGAGKSTVLRCMNGLEKPTAGEVYVFGENITGLSENGLIPIRKNMGMIFQHFNLLHSKDVYDNILLPLKHGTLSKAERDSRVRELLQLVGLEDKIHAYPSQLSGGQKQRIAIARALATNPKILLCDEATSALDPQTTRSILELLKDIHKKLGITIVIITHQMEVIKAVCTRVAVMEYGKVLEEGPVTEIFVHPTSRIAEEFVTKDYHYERLSQPEAGHISRMLHLKYVGNVSGKPLISEVSRRFEVEVNITQGDIEKLQETWIGNLVVDIQGEEAAVNGAVAYLKKEQVEMEVIADDRIHNAVGA